MVNSKFMKNYEKFSKYSVDCRGFLNLPSFPLEKDSFSFCNNRFDVSGFEKVLDYLRKTDFIMDKVFADKLYSAFIYVCTYGKVDFASCNKFNGFVYDRNGMKYHLWITISDKGIVFNSQCFDTKSNEALNLCASYENFDDKCSYNVEYDLNYNVDKDIYSHNISTLVSNGYETFSFERDSFRTFFDNSCACFCTLENEKVRDCDYVIESRSNKVDISREDGCLIKTFDDSDTFIGEIDDDFSTSLNSSYYYNVDRDVFDSYLNDNNSVFDVYERSRKRFLVK